MSDRIDGGGHRPDAESDSYASDPGFMVEGGDGVRSVRYWQMRSKAEFSDGSVLMEGGGDGRGDWGGTEASDYWRARLGDRYAFN